MEDRDRRIRLPPMSWGLNGAIAVGLFALQFAFRLGEGEAVWRAFVCAANPIASQHEPACGEGGFPWGGGLVLVRGESLRRSPAASPR
jgi:hypothetical protein